MNVLAHVRNTVPKVIIILILAFIRPSISFAQDTVLNSKLTFRVNEASISSILKSITRKTGYYFTYDTDLVEPERRITLRLVDKSLRNILDSVFYDRNINYSIIDNHIILFKEVNSSTPTIKEEGKEPVYNLSGVITNADNGEPLPYATIGIESKGKGTISNYEGEYSLKLTKEYIDDTLIVSSLGFYQRRLPVNQAINSNLNISLTRKFIPIPEVIIRNREPKELIRNVNDRIRQNYGISPVQMTAFYRESVSKRNKILMYSEAVIELYKSAYRNTLLNDQVKVYKSRKIDNLESSDTLTFKLKSGLDGCLELDGIKNGFDFLREENLGDYDFRMTDIINIGDEAAYVIEFEQKEAIKDLALPKGIIYINTTNYGVHATEFSINEDYIDKLDRSIIQQSARGYKIRVRQVKYRINYRYIDGRYYLNHVRGDLDFFARKRNRLFGSTYSIFFEMAVTNTDTLNVQRFNREERAPVHSIFSETINNYDREFWGTDNYLKPEESIKDALARINARLGEYTSNNSQ